MAGACSSTSLRAGHPSTARNGTDYTKCFGALRETIEAISAENAVIDGELVACGDTQQSQRRDDEPRVSRNDI